MVMVTLLSLVYLKLEFWN